MSGRYTANGRRRSSMTHARHGHTCDVCGDTVFGNGGVVSHGRKHVRQHEAVELIKEHGGTSSTRAFLAIDDAVRIAKFEDMGFSRVTLN